MARIHSLRQDQRNPRGAAFDPELFGKRPKEHLKKDWMEIITDDMKKRRVRPKISTRLWKMDSKTPTDLGYHKAVKLRV